MTGLCGQLVLSVMVLASPSRLGSDPRWCRKSHKPFGVWWGQSLVGQESGYLYWRDVSFGRRSVMGRCCSLFVGVPKGYTSGWWWAPRWSQGGLGGAMRMCRRLTHGRDEP